MEKLSKSTPQRSLRVDAERNRDRIMDAARGMYAREGLQISMAAVAREAGVGKATLARRFGSRGDLIAAVFTDHMRQYVAATAAALTHPDPWQGFTGYIETVLGMQAADRGFADVLTIIIANASDLEVLRAESYQGFLELISRAKATGHLRQDFESEDFLVALMANAGVVNATGQVTPDAWKRLVGQFLRAFANPGAPLPPMPKAPSSDDLYQAMVRDTPPAAAH